MWKWQWWVGAVWVGAAVLAAVLAWTILGRSQQPAAVIEEIYTVTPGAVTVKAGIVTGENAEMKVRERVEQGSDRVVSPAKLSGTLQLKITSTNQTVRLVAGTIQYI